MNNNEVIDIHLSSVSIFWKDLGLDIYDSDMKRYAERKWHIIEKWLNENIEDRYNVYSEGIWFLNHKDAILFKLTWAGKII